jgi:hypothetical protein
MLIITMIVCALLLLLCRWGTNTFGQGCGTLLGLGVVGLAVIWLFAMLGVLVLGLIGFLAPLTLPIIICLILGFVVTYPFRKTDEQKDSAADPVTDQ